MVVRKKGVASLPNQRSILSLLNRVEDDVELEPFYRDLSKQYGGKPMLLDSFLDVWNECVVEHLDGTEWFEWAVENYPQYVKKLVLQNNPAFAMTLISRYENDPSLRPVSGKKIRPNIPVTTLNNSDVISVSVTDSNGGTNKSSGVVLPPAPEPEPAPKPVVETVTAMPAPKPVVEPMPEPALEPTVVAEESSDSISSQEYDDMVTEVKSYDKIADLREFAEVYEIPVSGTSKQGIRDAIISELGDRVE